MADSERCTPPMPPERASDLATAFKALGDPVRLRLLSMIAARNGDEVCVCELTIAFTQSDATISHHLKVLRKAGLVTSERRGTWVYYRIAPDRLTELSALLAFAQPGGPEPVVTRHSTA
ncbi:MAG TPA: metalloregulator ArsR/SmtB family transcription factor [Candidatus Stackebrandtia excrementipullorum]|nr:metalloregulator ArsR/SmtB family transcription factor [Candidatus Stackebrandtia excrementipullorum]